MKRDIILTTITQAVVMLLVFGLFKLASHMFGAEGLSRFSFVKRNISFILPLLILGTGVGLPRYIAYCETKDKEKVGLFYWAAVIIISAGLLLSLLLFLLAPGPIVSLMFNDTAFLEYLWPIWFNMAGLLTYSLAYGYYRGRNLMVYANLIQLLYLGILPLTAFLVADQLVEVFWYTGVAQVGAGALLHLGIIRRFQVGLPWRHPEFRSCFKKIVTYSIQRVPSDFGLSALLSLPAVFTDHFSDAITAGYVAFAFSVLRMAEMFFVPIGMVMLPRASQAAGEDRFHQLKKPVAKMTVVTILLSYLGIGIFWQWGEELLGLYLSAVNTDMVSVVRYVLLGATANNIFVTLRSIIDAFYERAVNTITILISLAAFLLLGAALHFSLIDISVLTAFLFAIHLLAALTLATIFKIFYNSSQGTESAALSSGSHTDV